MDTINDRMEVIVNEKFNGNKAAFAKAIDVEPTTLSSYLGVKRRSKPSVDMVSRIVTALGVDAFWLLTGEGVPYPKGDTPTKVGTHANKVETHGDYSPATGEGDVTVDDSLLKERIKLLEQLLAEKERLIQVLMEGRK